MPEDLGQIIERLFIDQWKLPEDLVRTFLSSNLSENSSLEQLREVTANLLQDMILNSEDK